MQRSGGTHPVLTRSQLPPPADPNRSSGQTKMQFKFSLDFVMPAEILLDAARKGKHSSNVDIRTVSKALLDLTSEATEIQSEILKDGNVDLGPFFDFWFVDAIECANRLQSHDDEIIVALANCIINAEKGIIKSKESFLWEMKRLGIKPNDGGQ